MYIAEDRGFFSDNGLAVTVREYDPPSLAIRDVAAGKLDLAGSSEYPVVLNVFAGPNFSIIARYDATQTVYLTARKDRGIANISDLRGKKIGVPKGTIAEFYLSRFLTLNGMDTQEVMTVDVQPPQFADAIGSGKIDALICWQPHANQIAGTLGDRVVVWPAQGGQPLFAVLVARNDWITQDPARAAGFLKSLDMAADYTAAHPAESRAIVQKRLNLTDTYMHIAWPANQFSISLDQSLILAMEDESRWMIANNMTDATEVPYFRSLIRTDGLRRRSPYFVDYRREKNEDNNGSAAIEPEDHDNHPWNLRRLPFSPGLHGISFMLPPAPPPAPLSVGLQPNEATALIYVAEDRGFFAKNGLNVTVRDYEPEPPQGSRLCWTGRWTLPVLPNSRAVTNILDGRTMSIICTDVRSP